MFDSKISCPIAASDLGLNWAFTPWECWDWTLGLGLVDSSAALVERVRRCVDSSTASVGGVMLGVDSAAVFSVTVFSGPTSPASVFDKPLSSNQVLLASLFFLLFSASWVKLLNWNQVVLFRPRSPALSWGRPLNSNQVLALL